MKLASVFSLVILALSLNACSDPRPRDCIKLVNDLSKLIKRMEKSGRFADDFLKRHRNQFNLIGFIAQFDNKKTPQEKTTEYIKYHIMIEQQLAHSKNISNIA